MKKIDRLILPTLLLILFPFIVFSQSSEYGIRFSGYVRTDVTYDSRQVEGFRENHLLLYPKAPLYDKNNNDINDAPSFNIQSLQSRLKGDFRTPDVFNAKVSGVLEAEFLGVSNGDINGFRLRHAYGKLSWPKFELLAGQYWHPFLVIESYAGTLGFTTGAPFQAFSRNPQIRAKYSLGKLKITGAVLAQRDFSSNGPIGICNDYQRNSGLPTGALQLQYVADSGNIILGAAAEYKSIKPFLSVNGFSTDERLNTLSYMAFIKFNRPKYYIKLQGSWFKNSYDLFMLGGYGISKLDSATGEVKYSPFTTAACWGDFQWNLNRFKTGVFVGYERNFGADEDLITKFIYARGTRDNVIPNSSINYMYRIAPRLTYEINKILLGAELEYTVAAFGTPGLKGDVNGTKETSNFRTMLTMYYNF